VAATAATGAGAQTAEINMMAGPTGSTAKAVVEDIAGLAKECGLNPVVNDTAGALDNLLAVKNNRYTQFGLIQADVINFLKTFETIDPKIANTLKNIRLAFPLYSEEIHVIVKSDIASLSDLSGKRVSIGDKSSGTFLTATVILDLLGISPTTQETLGPEDSLAALISGDLDAFFFVDGVPSQVFDGVDLTGSDLKLLQLDDPLLSAVYESTVIEGGTYAFAPDDTQVAKVGSIMITYDYKPKKNRDNLENCKMISDVTRLVHDNIADLSTIGHPKWIEVDPSAFVPDLERSQCVQLALEPDYQISCQQ
jgi:TRAP transporter TAXI family solute receptor